MSTEDFKIHDGLMIKVIGRLKEELLPLLEKYSVRILDDSDKSVTPELIVTYGGDGTLLGAERDFPGIPKLPLRDRTHNPRCGLHSEKQCLDAFFNGEMRCDSLCKLQATSCHDGKTLTALNDIVVSRQVHPLGAIRYRVRQNGEILQPQVIADALVIATPYGSTGYFHSITRGNFQNGIGLAFSNAMEGQLFQIIPESDRLEIEILRGPAIVQAGNNPDSFTLVDGQTLAVSKAPVRATIFGLDAFRCRTCFLLRNDAAK
ncbi:MAG: hypothetical protein MJ106_03460 [Lentisphaeria bacterium]|nr:hypothetical protein [Lentisphaeria bacterium]